MKNTLFLVCENSSIDKETGQWSFFKSIEKINLNISSEKLREDQKISLQGKFNLISFWSKEKGESDLEIKYQLLDNTGEVLINTPSYKISTKEDIPVLKHRLIINYFIAKESGRYFFKVFQKKNNEYREESKLAIDVRIKKVKQR